VPRALAIEISILERSIADLSTRNHDHDFSARVLEMHARERARARVRVHAHCAQLQSE
jgi:hypothetical protein